jgi:hypothetical protein
VASCVCGGARMYFLFLVYSLTPLRR